MLDHEPTPEQRDLMDVIDKRLSWASMHWNTERVAPEAWAHIAKAIIAAGWRPPAADKAARNG